jgi:hypothetical protein
MELPSTTVDERLEKALKAFIVRRKWSPILFGIKNNAFNLLKKTHRPRQYIAKMKPGMWSSETRIEHDVDLKRENS